MAKRSRHLVVQHLENISRTALEKYQKIIREYIKDKKGVYALYRRDKLKYVGLATDLRIRLKTHLTDRHAQTWDKFSIYLTENDEHLRLAGLGCIVFSVVEGHVGGAVGW